MPEATWVEPDWDAPRPSWLDVQHTPLVLEQVAADHPNICELLLELRRGHINGGAQFATFRCDAAPQTWGWAASRNRFSEYRFLTEFFKADVVRAALPSLDLTNATIKDEDFDARTDAFDLSGAWARMVFYGGAYERFSGNAASAAALVGRAADELVQGRYDEFNVFLSRQALTSWYLDVAWDSTWVVIDKRNLLVHLLSVTDTD